MKSLGAQPGDPTDSCSFTLPAHINENLTDQQSAERIAAHFSAISQEFSPLNIESLPESVKNKLKCPGVAPSLSNYHVYRKVMHAKKPKSGTPNDIPKELVKEFSPELATPLTKIFNKMFCH